jgi:hypothetical protein
MNVVCEMIGLSQEGMQYTSLLHHATSKDEGIAKTHPEILFDCSELLCALRRSRYLETRAYKL